jgi:hypothetical protein
MGGFMGIGNSSAKTDRGRTLGGWQAEWEQLAGGREAFGKLFPGAVQGGQAGTATVGAGADFWKDILGSRQEAAAAVAPETNQIAAQADAARQAQAQLGTSRGGGVAAANQQQQQQVMGAQNQALLNARPQAATGAVQAGQAQAQIAAQQLHAALTAMGMSNEVAKHIVDSSMQSRVVSDALNKQRVNQWTGVASRLLGVIPGGNAVSGILNG